MLIIVYSAAVFVDTAPPKPAPDPIVVSPSVILTTALTELETIALVRVFNSFNFDLL